MMPAGGKPYGPKSGNKRPQNRQNDDRAGAYPGGASGRFRTDAEKRAAGRMKTKQMPGTFYTGSEDAYGGYGAHRYQKRTVDPRMSATGDAGVARRRAFNMAQNQISAVERTALGGADRATARARGAGMTKAATNKARLAGQAATTRMKPAAATNKGRGAAPTKKAATAKRAAPAKRGSRRMG